MSSKGAHVESVIDKVQEQASAGVVTHAPDAATQDQAGAMASSLPRQFGKPSGRWDNQVEMKRQLIEKSGSPNTPYGQITFSDRDARALLEKKKAAEAAAFDGWFGEHFNTNDLPTRLLGEQLNPEYFEKREEQLVQKAELALRIELMKLYGPRSEEDLMILFGLQTGYLRLEDGWNVIGAAESVESAANKARFQREVSSVSRFFMGQGDGVDSTRADEAVRNRGKVAWGQQPFAVVEQVPTVADSVLAGQGSTGLSGFFDFLRGQ